MRIMIVIIVIVLLYVVCYESIIFEDILAPIYTFLKNDKNMTKLESSMKFYYDYGRSTLK